MKILLILSLSIASVFGKGPANDDLENAAIIAPKLPANVRGSLTDQLDRFRATREEGEPDHAGLKNHGSVWYSWTPEKSERVKAFVGAINMDMILATYTGDSYENLSLVHRYEDFAFPAFSTQRTEPFSRYAKVEFDAQAGTTYHFALSAENALFEIFTFKIESISNPLKPQLELLEPGSNWEFLIAVDDEGIPVDPKSLDPDFFHTWMFPKRYDGPKFSSGRAPVGYGDVGALKIRANLIGKRGKEPAKNRRYTSYLRTTFTPAIDVTALGFEALVDDGMIAYINGKEVLRLNVASEKDPQDWQTLAAHETLSGKRRTEEHVQYGVVRNLNLPADVPVNLSISLHNASLNSTDMGLDLRLFSLMPEGVK